MLDHSAVQLRLCLLKLKFFLQSRPAEQGCQTAVDRCLFDVYCSGCCNNGCIGQILVDPQVLLLAQINWYATMRDSSM